MGELYFRMGRYDDSEEVLTKGVSIRGVSFDAAVARENLAQMYEHKGNLALAKEIRTLHPKSMVCGNLNMRNVRRESNSYCHCQASNVLLLRRQVTHLATGN